MILFLEGGGSVLHSVFHTSEQCPLDLQFNIDTVTLFQELIAQSFYQMVTSLGNKKCAQEGMTVLTSKPLVLCKFLYVWKRWRNNLWRALHVKAFLKKKRSAPHSLDTILGGDVQRHLKHSLLQIWQCR